LSKVVTSSAAIVSTGVAEEADRLDGHTSIVRRLLRKHVRIDLDAYRANPTCVRCGSPRRLE